VHAFRQAGDDAGLLLGRTLLRLSVLAALLFTLEALLVDLVALFFCKCILLGGLT
jgi:hypothetical protein